jgi:hypothetical protein
MAEEYFEVIYEDGSYSLLCGEEAEIVDALKVHNDRAKSGQAGGPAGQPATRVKRLLKYDKNPADRNEDGTLTKDEIKEIFKDTGDVVNVDELISKLRQALDPVDSTTDVFESNFKLPESSEVDLTTVMGGDS